MLRYCCLLSLLICINNSFCYEYTSHIDLKSRSIRRAKTDNRYQRENLQHKNHHKRHDYDSNDKDPVAEIDVASFINSVEDESNIENDPNNKLWNGRNNENYYDSLANGILNNKDYSDVEAENVEEISHNSIHFNPLSKDKIISDKFAHETANIHRDNLDNNLIDQNKKQHKEKKCAFKNIKLPFFSHKSTIAKVKNDKKRKNYSFHNFRKTNAIRKDNNENFLKHDNPRDNSDFRNHDKVKKRSYIERLCPVCRRKFIVHKSLCSQKEINNILQNKYDLSPQNFEENLQNNQKHLNTPTSNEKGIFENYWSDKRRKREDDDRNIERQKELEYLEKRVEGVTVNNPSYNRVNT